MNNISYRFTRDWFSHCEHLFSKYLKQYKDRPVKFLEVGCYEGKTSIWMLANILTHNNAHITCLDSGGSSVAEGGEKHRNRNLKHNLSFWKDKTTIIEKRSNYIKNFENETFDFIYIDACHDAEYVLMDSILSFMILKVGGIIAFDDYEWDKGENNPKKAIDPFLEIYKDYIKILHKSWQVWIIKIESVPEWKDEYSH